MKRQSKEEKQSELQKEKEKKSETDQRRFKVPCNERLGDEPWAH
jgi:hypothetical protein